MKFGVVQFPGTHGAEDTLYLLTEVMQQQAVKLWYQDTQLDQFDTQDCIILPGGAAHGDYLRPGALTALSPILDAIKAFAQKGGYVFGIGNGFQILCEAGLLPGLLLRNANNQFIAKDVYLKTITSNSPITAAISPEEVLKLPLASQFGRYFIDAETFKGLEENDQILFKYCDEEGKVLPDHNPNGSIQHIAGVCNSERNVFALMPHPERAAETELNNEDGRFLFESLFRTAKIDVINH
jgi:phosphoribosylformylglycinamidine synthase